MPGWAYAALGAVLVVGLAFLRGLSQGAAGERRKGTEETLERKQETEEIEREVEGLPDDELDKKGCPWVRP